MLIAYGPFSKTRAWFQFGDEQVQELDTPAEAVEYIRPIRPKEPGRDKEKRLVLEQQSAQALSAATAAAHTRAANAQEEMAKSSKSVSQSIALKALQDSLKLEREYLCNLVKNPVADDPNYETDLNATKQRIREYQSNVDELLKIIVKGVMPSPQP